jgi:hypothetical protein
MDAAVLSAGTGLASTFEAEAIVPVPLPAATNLPFEIFLLLIVNHLCALPVQRIVEATYLLELPWRTGVSGYVPASRHRSIVWTKLRALALKAASMLQWAVICPWML